MGWARSFLWVIGMVAMAKCAGAAGITDGLTVYCPYDSSTLPKIIAGSSTPSTPGPFALTDGVHGKGLLVDDTKLSHGTAYPCIANMDVKQGTVAFRVKPAQLQPIPSSPDKFRFFFICCTDSGAGSGFKIFWSTSGGGSLTAAMAVIDDSGWRWVWAPLKEGVGWKPEEWHHVAVTWVSFPGGGGERKLYLDGGLAAEDRFSAGVSAGFNDEMSFYLGGTLNDQGKDSWGIGSYDDLAIWRRPLSEAEVKGLYDGKYQEELNNAVVPSLLPRLPKVTLGESQTTFDLADRPESILRNASVTVLSDTGTVGDGERLEFSFSWNLDPAHLPKSIEIRTTDFWGKPAGKTILIRRPAAKGSTTSPLSVMPGRKGIFRVTAVVSSQQRDLFTFAVIPASVIDRPDNPDGVVGTHLWWEDAAWHAKAGRRMGIDWTRFHDACQCTWWTKVQPTDGPFAFWDEPVDTFRSKNISILGLLEATPKWASTSDIAGLFQTYPPKDWSKYEEYVRAVVSHWKGSIHAWEVWNEPGWNGFWNGTVEEYVHLSKLTYENIKKIDPTATVIGLGGSAQLLPWTEEVFKAGALKYCDAISYHYYEADESTATPDPKRDLVANLRALMAKYGEVKPIWDTEDRAGIGSFNREYRSSLDTESEVAFSAAGTSRKIVFNTAAGVKKTILYDMMRRTQRNAQWVKTTSRVIEDYGFPHPAGVAASNAANLLYGTQPASRLDPDPRVAICLFKRVNPTGDPKFPEKGGSMAVVVGRKWAETDAPAQWRLTKGLKAPVTVVDMMGGILQSNKPLKPAIRLSAEPIFIIAPTLNPEELGDALAAGKVE